MVAHIKIVKRGQLKYFRLVSNAESQRQQGIFNRNIQRWEGRQQRTRDAMSKHANWLRQFGQEIQGARNSKRSSNKQTGHKEVRKGMAAKVLSPNVKRAAGLMQRDETTVEDL